MKIDKIASVICRGVWLLDPRIADGLMPSVARHLNGERVSWFDDDDDDEEDDKVRGTYCISPGGNIIALKAQESGSIFSEAPQGSVAVITISGTIMKNDYCGSVGTETMAGWLKDAYASENISAVVLKINSGGGSVEGTGEFAEVVSQANKPVVAYTDGLMASAAYWIGSSALEIFASFETVEIGSIGTAISFYDNREALAKLGYKLHYINADPSIDKNQDYFKALDGNYTPIRTHVLNPTNDVFLNSVKRNREGKLALLVVKHEDGNTYYEPLTGQVYLAKKAIELGLIDKIGSFEAAVDRAQELASHPSQIIKKSNNMFGFNKFSKLAALANLAAASITADQVKAVNEEIVAAGIGGVTLVLDAELETVAAENGAAAQTSADLQAAQTRISALEAELETAKAQNAELATITADRDAWKAKAEEFGAAPAAEPTSGKKNGTDAIQNTDGDADKFHSEADEQLAAARVAAGLSQKVTS